MGLRTSLSIATVIVTAAAAVAARAETVTLESPVLRLEVETEPYRYRVIEKASGEVLLVQSATTFTTVTPVIDAGVADAGADGPGDGGALDVAPEVGSPPPPREVHVVAARARVATTELIELDLTLAGSAVPGRAQFRFGAPEVLEVALTAGAEVTRRVEEEFVDGGEHNYGIWEYPWEGTLDNRGRDEAYLGLGSRTGSLYTSARAPFYVTSRRYGVYARSNARGHFTVAVAGKTGFWFDERELRYDFIYGPSYYDVIRRYTAIAGGPFMPPLWAFGTMWWHDDFHRDLRQAANAQANVIDLASQLQAQRIPAAAILVDRPYGTGSNGWGNMDWNPSSFPAPAQMVSDLHARGLELVIWIANRGWNNLFTEGRARGYLFPGSMSLGPAADMRVPAAYDWWKEKLAPFVALGAKGYKIDRGEQGEHPDSVQSENVTLYARMAQETLAARHGAEGFVFARNVSDRGRQHTAVWNGDAEANFTGLIYSIAAGLRSGIIVMPMWGSDTGGYLRGEGGPSEELFARWFGFSAYSPMMEVLVGDGHTPWYHYSPRLVEIARKQSRAHHDLIPYTRSLLQLATRTGIPVMRPLVFEQPEASHLADLADQYLFGPELMVAPVVSPGADARAVYLPPGRWLEYHERRLAGPGGRSVLARAPLDTIPVFVREGAIVPRGDILKANNDWTPGWAPSLRIEIFPAAGDLARTFEYFTGSAVVPIAASTAGGVLTIDLPALAVDGVLEVALAGYGRVLRDGVALAPADVAGRYDAAARKLVLPFGGDAATRYVIEAAVSVFDRADPLPAHPAPDLDAGVPDAAPDAAGDAGPAPTPGGCAYGGTPSTPGGLLLVAVLLAFLRRRRWLP